MAEKFVIAEIDMNMDAAIADISKLREEEIKLKQQTEQLKKDQGVLSSEYIQSSANLKALQGDLRTQENLLVKVTAAGNEQVGTVQRLEAANAKLRNEQKGLILETKKGRKRNAEINKEINENTQLISDNSDKRKQNIMNIGNYTSALGDSGVAINAATSAAQTFGTVLKVMLGPIGWVAAAIAALISYFKRSEEGQNSLAKATAVFQVVLQNMLDVVSAFGEALFNAVTKPKEAWQKFKDFVAGVGRFFQDTFGNVIGGSIEVFVGFMQKAFARVGLAWQKFKDVFIDNSEGINDAQSKIDEYNKKIEDGQDRVKKGAENLKEGVVGAYGKMKNALTEFVKENEREIEIAKKLADQKAALDKLERINTVQTAKEVLKLNELKNAIDDKTNSTAEERLKLINEESELLDEQIDRQLKIAQGRYELKRAQNALSSSTKEDLTEEANLLAKVYEVQASIEAQRKEIIAKRAEVATQILAEQRLVAQSSVDSMIYELEQYKLLNRDKLDITQETVRKQQEILRSALEIKIAEIDARENQSEAAKNAEKLKLQQDYQLQSQTLQLDYEEAERQRRLEVLQTDYDNELTLAEENLFAQLDIQKKLNDLKRKEEIRAAEKTGANVALINAKYDKADRALEKARIDAKLSLAQQFASNIATIASENTKVGKAAAVAATTIETYKSAQSAFSALAPIPIVGPILGAVAAAAAVAAGIANVKKILSVQPGISSAPSASGSVPAATSSTSAAPATVLTSSLQNVNTELGQGIVSRSVNGETAQQKTQVVNTLVVDDVTNKQIEADAKSETATI
jgi:hypothetical protein